VASVIEEVGENRVRLTVDVPADDVHHAVEHAASDLATAVKIPGFRKGKVPIQVLLARVGKERLFSEAVESHIGNWFWNAAATTRVRPIESPQFEYELPASDREDWRFSATFAVQPKPELPDWTTLEVGAVEPEVPREVVDSELEELQAMVAELAPVEDRAAQPGDVVVIDLVDDGTGQAQRDYVVELGAGRLVDEIEQGLTGLAAGDSRELEFARGDGSSRKVTVKTKQIFQRILPPLDDEVARAVSEFETLDELRADIESELREQLVGELEGKFRADVVDALVGATDVNAAGPLVEARTRELLRGLVRSLERRGIDPNAYLSMTGETPEQLDQRLRAEAARSVARELVLEAAADKLGIDVTDEDIKTLIREQAQEAGDDPDRAVEEVFSAGAVEPLRQDLRLRAALDRVAAEVKRIPAELAAVREKLWTPEKEKQPGEAKLWTPGSKESA
jgi:trigger factor